MVWNCSINFDGRKEMLLQGNKMAVQSSEFFFQYFLKCMEMVGKVLSII